MLGFTCPHTSLRRNECVLEVLGRNHTTLPMDQPFVYEGLVGSGGREAGFFFVLRLLACPSVEWTTPSVSDGDHSTIRGAYASYYAPHARLPQELRENFRRDLFVTARHVQDTTGLPFITRDVNTWHRHFTLSLSRSCDASIIPFIVLLMS